VNRALASALFGVARFDVATVLLVAGLLVTAALLAAAVPVLRAAAMDPSSALRAEHP
jgi:hypothetical protein